MKTLASANSSGDAEEAASKLMDTMGVSKLTEGQVAEFRKKLSEEAASPIVIELTGLLESLELTDRLDEALEWFHECEVDSIAELKAAELESYLPDALELEDERAKLLLERLAAM
jgi:hypothetical protein